MEKGKMLNIVRSISWDLHHIKNEILKTIREYLYVKDIYEKLSILEIDTNRHRIEIIEYYNALADYGFYLQIYNKQTRMKDAELKVLLSHEKFVITFVEVDAIGIFTEWKINEFCDIFI
jgi:hypothetical protein